MGMKQKITFPPSLKAANLKKYKWEDMTSGAYTLVFVLNIFRT
jgi:hypothetical protein